MCLKTLCGHLTLGVVMLLGTICAQAADYPKPQEGTWLVKDFRFHTGEVLPELKLHYMTIGAPSGEPALVLHGSSASGQTMLTNDFAGELFGAGQPLVFHHHSGRDRLRQIVTTLGRIAYALSEIHL
jgi:homoserine O-acetyltransferase